MGIPIVIVTGVGISIAVLAFAVYRRSHPATHGADFGSTDTISAKTVYRPIEVTRNTPPVHKKHYYGVSVRPGVNCCDAIRAIAKNRYLQGQAPRPPLPGCDREDCRCIMHPENDRRTNIDRRADAFSAYGDYRDNWHPHRRREVDGQDRRKT